MQSLLRIEIEFCRGEMREKTPENPALHGCKCYSQFDEDGIIAYITDTLRIEHGSFVELGAANGLENNTHLLLLKGWRGLWVDADPKNAAFVRAHIPANVKRLSFDQSFIDCGNVNSVIDKGLTRVGAEELDLLSIDLDGNDAWLLEEILTQYKPKIIVAEYNGKLPFGLRMTVPYDPKRRRAGDDFYGASLSEIIARLPGYRLVACGLSGVNAYFVRDDLTARFPEYPPVDLYQPSRVHFILLSVGSPPTLKFLAASVEQ
jgi:hypothetical protein